MKYGLYRDAPFRPLFAEGHGFQEPLRDECRPLWVFSSMGSAEDLRRNLRHDSGGGGFVQIASLRVIKERMKERHQC